MWCAAAASCAARHPARHRLREGAQGALGLAARQVDLAEPQQRLAHHLLAQLGAELRDGALVRRHRLVVALLLEVELRQAEQRERPPVGVGDLEALLEGALGGRLVALRLVRLADGAQRGRLVALLLGRVAAGLQAAARVRQRLAALAEVEVDARDAVERAGHAVGLDALEGGEGAEEARQRLLVEAHRLVAPAEAQQRLGGAPVVAGEAAHVVLHLGELQGVEVVAGAEAADGEGREHVAERLARLGGEELELRVPLLDGVGGVEARGLQRLSTDGERLLVAHRVERPDGFLGEREQLRIQVLFRVHVLRRPVAAGGG